MPTRLPAAKFTSTVILGQFSNATDTAANYRITHRMMWTGSDISLVYTNPDNSAVFAGTANPITLRAAIELADGTKFPVFFKGKRDAVIDSGGIAVSDPLGIEIAAGATFYSRCYITVSSGQYWPTGGLYKQSTDGVEHGVGITDKTTSGTIPLNVVDSYYGPAAVLATPAAPAAARAVLIVGDSIPDGTGDSFTDGLGDWGYVYRAVWGAGFAGVRAEKGGEAAQSWAVYNTGGVGGYPVPIREMFAACCTHAVVEYGINDLGSNNRTFAQLQADVATICNRLMDKGVVPVLTTLTPRATSTDSFATLGNQTPLAALATTRPAYNDWVRAGGPGGGVRVWDVTPACESSLDSGKWVVTGAANYATTDGIHPTAAIHAAMAATLPAGAFA